ncbi:hypothetical protein GCM10027280_16610 [Micromonospora polyrhachis]|uniref:Uncharacterized protein n=1 Tax=Micromonospora polyrhachis TaxID=1282883 RepID=A0A7W7SQ01_9ACTN|nr:hypothetical protein [Micromonospora polyrhachis]MBB4958451.1 hypothetical protein [Micromonospora polyrhachis]
MDGVDLQRRWPAYPTAVVFLSYAAGKAAFALQARLGLPSGPVVSAAEHERYAREVMDVAPHSGVRALGLLGACLVLATVTALGGRVPRPLMLLMLVGMTLAAGAGAVVMIVDGFIGIGVGWQ